MWVAKSTPIVPAIFVEDNSLYAMRQNPQNTPFLSSRRVTA